MKKYLLFVGESFYPAGGWSDFVTDGDDQEKLVEMARTIKDEHPMQTDWWQVVDTETRKFVAVYHDHAEVGDESMMAEWARERGYLE